MNGLSRILKTLRGEGFVALLTGLITFGILELLAPHTPAVGAAFGLVAAVSAGALDTLYFHLLYRLREAPVHMAEKRHTQSLDDARRRLADGSIRLREALIRRFEADYQRTAATVRVDSRRSRRQLRAARQWLQARLWVTDHVIPGDQFAAANHEAKSNPGILEVWTDQVDALVDARLEVLRREGFAARLVNRFRPAYSARQTLEEWRTFAQNS